MKHTFCLTAMVALLLCCFLLASCTAASNDSTGSNPSTPSDPDSAATVTVQYLSDTSINEDTCIQYTDEKMNASSEAIIFTTTQNVSNFKFLQLQFNVATEEYEVIEELFSLPELTSSQPLVIHTVVSETLADRGFCFTTEDGTVQYYTIRYNTRDGGVLVSQFEK